MQVPSLLSRRCTWNTSAESTQRELQGSNTIRGHCSDGVSMTLFQSELLTAYVALRDGHTEPELPALAIQYADYAAWQREYLASGALDAQRAYWKTQLANAPLLLEFPTDFPRPPQPSGRGGSVVFEVSSAVSARFSALRASCGASAFMAVLAAWQVIMWVA